MQLSDRVALIPREGAFCEIPTAPLSHGIPKVTKAVLQEMHNKLKDG